MALLKDITIDGTNITVTNAYLKIVSMNITTGQVIVSVNIYQDEATFTANPRNRIDNMAVGINFADVGGEAGFSFAAVYTHLKTLPAFLGATDAV